MEKLPGGATLGVALISFVDWVVPVLFDATTTKKYVVPLVSPLTVQVVVGAVTVQPGVPDVFSAPAVVAS
jgi:hypothetical protein